MWYEMSRGFIPCLPGSLGFRDPMRRIVDAACDEALMLHS